MSKYIIYKTSGGGWRWRRVQMIKEDKRQRDTKTEAALSYSFFDLSISHLISPSSETPRTQKQYVPPKTLCAGANDVSVLLSHGTRVSPLPWALGVPNHPIKEGRWGGLDKFRRTLISLRTHKNFFTSSPSTKLPLFSLSSPPISACPEGRCA